MNNRDLPAASRSVVMLVYPGVASVDVTGPLEVFGLANFLTGQRLYVPMTASVDGEPVSVAGGFLTLEPTCSCAELPDRIDTLLVAGGPGCFAASDDEELLSWLQRLKPRCARMGSVCTGSTVLLSSGIVDGQRIATHWLEAKRLQSVPELATEVDNDAIFVESGNFWTSAGMMAGIDLALALIERDQGRALALDIARFMVMVLRRDSGQSQFSSQLMAEATEDPQIRKIQLQIWENPGADLSLERLAKIVGMSKRSLSRRFASVTGTTLSTYIEDVRLHIARRLLEISTQRIEVIAHKAGFGTTTSMRRTFSRRLGVSPNQYRSNFGTAEEESGKMLHIEDGLRMDIESIVSGKSAW